ncbi:MAG TPA: GntR family transcriptional regulator [Alphaproteobacteria bacterium]|nr:GntR family transcriptional regulator [Alphaproteobacteria bacterium]
MEKTRTSSAKTVVEATIEAIKSGIFEGRYAPGQRLIEADLTRELSVSRGPLREALGRLVADGLVDIEPYRGAIVSRPSRDDVANTLQLREVLEGLAARLAAERIEIGDNRNRLMAERDAIAKSDAGREVATFMSDNERFHGLVLELSGNPQLARLVSQMQLPTLQTAFFRMIDQKVRSNSLAQHGEILNAILAGDGNAAERAMRTHIARTSELAKRLPDALFGA